MKKKVYYKLNRYKVAKVEVESVEQEQDIWNAQNVDRKLGKRKL